MISSDWQSQIFEKKKQTYKKTPFKSLVFFEISYSDSLQHCVTHSGGKAHEKTWGPNFGSNGPKMRVFFPNFLTFAPLVSISFLLYCIE